MLSALLDKGLLKLGNFTAAADKRRHAYVLTPKGLGVMADLTRKFLIRKMTEYNTLKVEIDLVAADVSDEDLAEIRARLDRHYSAPG